MLINILNYIQSVKTWFKLSMHVMLVDGNGWRGGVMIRRMNSASVSMQRWVILWLTLHFYWHYTAVNEKVVVKSRKGQTASGKGGKGLGGASPGWLSPNRCVPLAIESTSFGWHCRNAKQTRSCPLARFKNASTFDNMWLYTSFSLARQS